MGWMVLRMNRIGIIAIVYFEVGKKEPKQGKQGKDRGSWGGC